MTKAIEKAVERYQKKLAAFEAAYEECSIDLRTTWKRNEADNAAHALARLVVRNTKRNRNTR